MMYKRIILKSCDRLREQNNEKEAAKAPWINIHLQMSQMHNDPAKMSELNDQQGPHSFSLLLIYLFTY